MRPRQEPPAQSRREFLSRAGKLAGWAGIELLGGSLVLSTGCLGPRRPFAPLGRPDSNGLRLPPGFTSRVIAVSGERVAETDYWWHIAPDGGATFPTPDGGWIYVSNSEVPDGNGGVSAIRFDANGEIRDAYSILRGTSRNCAGGPTPWGTWLSCEEVEFGQVYECDPYVPGSEGVVRPALGAYKHEAAAVDPVRRHVYLTEDEPDGLLYRFTPAKYPSLDAGLLEALEILDPLDHGDIAPGERRPLDWHVISDPSGSSQPTRFQAVDATAFDGGEGCSYGLDAVYFSTKGDDRVWRLDTRSDEIEIIYDRRFSIMPILSGVDNVLATPSGEVYVAEDPGELKIVALSPSGRVTPIVQITGQRGSEVTGPALSPDGTRLYFSSQRYPGTTYEVRGLY